MVGVLVIPANQRKDERMAAKIEALEAKVLELGIEDRARLAGKLIISLDAPEEEENLRLWVAEAERRLQQLRDGKAKEIPARDVFRRARAAL
jgi:putative addiction module component (TIGR02574 family)